MFGMTWDEFWYEDLGRLEIYWKKHQYELEARNHELWMQGLYIRDAVASVFDSSRKCKYPEKPHRITPMTDAEKELEAKRSIEKLREQLNDIKRMSDARNKGGG